MSLKDFLRRYWREGNRALLVLAAAGAILLIRRLRPYRTLTVTALIGAILVAGWLLVGPLLTIPRFTTEGPVVRNGVAAVVVCGEKRGGPYSRSGLEGMDAAMKYVPEPRTGTWWPVREGECTTWYHRPPGFEQRHNRHERAEQTTIAACGTERDLAGVTKAIPEPMTGTWGTEPRGTCKVHYHHPPDRWQRVLVSTSALSVTST